MILLWGLASDTPMASVRAELARLGRTALMLDQRAVLETMVDFCADGEVACSVVWGGLRLELSGVTAAYFRPYDPYGVPAVAQLPKQGPAARHAAAIYEALRLWGDLTRARVVNRLG